jgi:hypothetical protein
MRDVYFRFTEGRIESDFEKTLCIDRGLFSSFYETHEEVILFVTLLPYIYCEFFQSSGPSRSTFPTTGCTRLPTQNSVVSTCNLPLAYM